MSPVIATLAWIAASPAPLANDYTALLDVRVVDGDTFEARIEIWPTLHKVVLVRVRGMDTPEMQARCPQEVKAAQHARTRLQSLLSNGNITLRDVRLGKFAGRVVSTVFVDGIDVSQTMIAEGHAAPYQGGKRKSWCD